MQVLGMSSSDRPCLRRLTTPSISGLNRSSSIGHAASPGAHPCHYAAGAFANLQMPDRSACSAAGGLARHLQRRKGARASQPAPVASG
jgi:hypothetical protein